MAENTKQFFQITEAARACGLSRSTLMRMEERGLLTPVFTAPDSGRRYYDNHNVARIMQIEKFKAMGLGSKEIADYFAQGGEAEVLLEALETRLRDLQRTLTALCRFQTREKEAPPAPRPRPCQLLEKKTAALRCHLPPEAERAGRRPVCGRAQPRPPWWEARPRRPRFPIPRRTRRQLRKRGGRER